MLKLLAAAAVLLAFHLSVVPLAAQESNDAALKPAERNRTGTLRELIPGYYVFSSTSFNSGVIATNEGVVVLDALSSPAIAEKEREAIASIIKQPVRFLVSSTFHNNYTWGNVAYRDVIKIGQEDYRSDLIAQMQRDRTPADEQMARLPQVTFPDRLTLHLGGKEIQILHLGKGHTRGDSIIFVPQDRIAYLSELYFSDQFLYINDGYGVSWLKTLDAVEALPADIFVPGHGPIPDDPKETRRGLHRFRQMLVDLRDAVQNAIARGATEDQAAASITLPQYEKLQGYKSQREIAVRRTYRELMGTLN
ncbi:MAG TPA: MBL fold metallo-hydrolase [Candidatus Binatia bacterium]|jgi:glyoxylase-like metal-dependent hydrolase (beta-lactamase superfamily II)